MIQPQQRGKATMPVASEARYVILNSGLAVPLEPVLLLLGLESRGFAIAAEPDDTLTVRPGSALTEEDRAALARWKAHMLALVRFTDDNGPRGGRT